MSSFVCRSAAAAMFAAVALTLSGAAQAQTPPPPLYVSTTGSDSNPGTQTQPLKTLLTAVSRVQDYGVIYVEAGTYPQTRSLAITKTWVTIQAVSSGKAVIENAGFAGALFAIGARGATLAGLKLDGKFVSGSRGIDAGTSAAELTVKSCEIKNFTRHAVDIDGPDTRLVSAHIHHILWWDDAQGGRVDAHGVVTTHAQRLTLKSCNIHHVSGDCFQAGRGNWQDVVIESSKLWDGPLGADMAGYKKGVRAAENAIDTKKAATVERGRIRLKKCDLYGFRTTLITNAAALNLKENVDAVVDSCDVRDSNIAFRLRGLGSNGEAWPSIVNCTIRTSTTAVRYEDGLKNLRLAFNTFDKCTRLFQRAPSSSPWGEGWVVANNLFHNVSSLPTEAPAASNRVAPSGTLNTSSLRSLTSEGLLGAPVSGVFPAWYNAAVTYDKDGRKRSATTPTMGAFEFVNS